MTISACRALQRHVSTHKDMLVFSEGDEILVKSKEAGNRPDLWGGEVSCSCHPRLNLSPMMGFVCFCLFLTSTTMCDFVFNIAIVYTVDVNLEEFFYYCQYFCFPNCVQLF